ncbi:MAG TPA: transposase [Candidatus Dormibacteraeota bacterium]|nr:transposase [Candidatus Dormibacteraeota bacterium]
MARRGAPRGFPIGAGSDGVPRPASWGSPKPGHPDPALRVGVDVGGRWLATMATAEGVIERVPNPAPLARDLTVPRRRSRSLSRSQRGSNRCRRKERRRARLQAHLAALRRYEIPRLTTRLATPHGRIVGEGLDAAGRLRQKGIPGARARRRGPADAALAELRRQLRYQTPWYGSEVVEAERCFASSRTCHGCGLVQDLGWAEHWRGDGGEARHRRDDHAAINLARYSPGAPHEAGPVGSPDRGSTLHRGSN